MKENTNEREYEQKITKKTVFADIRKSNGQYQ